MHLKCSIDEIENVPYLLIVINDFQMNKEITNFSLNSAGITEGCENTGEAYFLNIFPQSIHFLKISFVNFK